MKLFRTKNSYFLYLVIIVCAAEVLVNPLGNFPLNDDWSYAQTLNIFYREHKVFLGNWPAMTLCTQILWGYLFTKLFGLSFFVLRCSTILSGLIGYYFLNKLIIRISGNHLAAFLACLALAFNPLIFNLSNTFMTDVNFNTLFIICCYCMYMFFTTGRVIYYLGFAIFSIALTLLRQYGIVFPACFMLACVFAKELKVWHLALGVMAFVITLMILKRYEAYLAVDLPGGAQYQYSGSITMDRPFFESVLASFIARYKEIIIYMLTYAMPFAIAFFGRLARQLKLYWIILISLVDLAVIYYIFANDELDTTSVFANMVLGAEIFRCPRHNTCEGFDTFISWVNAVSSFITLFVILMQLTILAKKRPLKFTFRPEVFCLVLVLLAYAFMLLITKTYFDRYDIPLISGAIILISYAATSFRVDLRIAFVPLLFWAYISVAGTKDYLAWNRLRWEAYWYLRTQQHVPANAINGGFEVSCWNEGRGWGYRDFFEIGKAEYLIQFCSEPGFRPVREYEFQRYFPYKKDKIYIFARMAKPDTLTMKR